MAAEAEAAREARAKVIAAEGEHKSSRALAHAAEVIAQSPAALQVIFRPFDRIFLNFWLEAIVFSIFSNMVQEICDRQLAMTIFLFFIWFQCIWFNLTKWKFVPASIKGSILVMILSFLFVIFYFGDVKDNLLRANAKW